VARVALVCEPPDGGVASHVRELALGLGAYGHEAVVFGPPGFAAASHVRFEPVPFTRDYDRPHRDAAALAALTRAVRRGGFDLVHAHAAKAGVLGRLAARAARLPALYTPHCLPFVGEVSEARRRFGVLAERALAPLTATIVCVCEDERRVALAAGLPERRLTVVHNGCPPFDPSTEAAPGAAALRAEGPVVAAIAVLRRQKRIDVLLDAAPAILAAVPDARIAIVGDGPEREALHAHAAARGLADEPRLAWLPFDPPDAAPHLAATDVYVLPSGWEAFPIGVLEALAAGVPQVATDVGGTREAVTAETGVLVPPRDPGRLAEAVIALLRDPDRRVRMAAASRARHAERFTIETMLARTAAVYDRALH
jgi:glycosyltransferase involved in cell wall biosynthesis